jgi:hypothetical protein
MPTKKGAAGEDCAPVEAKIVHSATYGMEIGPGTTR